MGKITKNTKDVIQIILCFDMYSSDKESNSSLSVSANL